MTVASAIDATSRKAGAGMATLIDVEGDLVTRKPEALLKASSSMRTNKVGNLIAHTIFAITCIPSMQMPN